MEIAEKIIAVCEDPKPRRDEIIDQAAMERAKQLLIENRSKVAQVAEALLAKVKSADDVVELSKAELDKIWSS